MMARRLGWRTCLAVILVFTGWLASPPGGGARPPPPAVAPPPGRPPLPPPDRPATGLADPADAVACQECHEDASEAYMRSAHGTMVELGDTRAPACADCHGNPHTIRPVDQWPDSQRAPACGGCHPGATASFTKALRHEPPP